MGIEQLRKTMRWISTASLWKSTGKPNPATLRDGIESFAIAALRWK